MGNTPSTPEKKDQQIEDLKFYIMQGPSRSVDAVKILRVLKKNNDLRRVENFRDDDISLLHLAAIFCGLGEVISWLVRECPSLLLLEREKEYEGQNVLHVLVSKKNVGAVRTLLNRILEREDMTRPYVGEREVTRLIMGKAVGSKFYKTVMMGELPLSVAALTFNKDMVDLLLKHGAEISHTDSTGDTVLHTLVRFAHLYPDEVQDVMDMLKYLHGKLKEQPENLSVWMMENNDGFTVLRLSVAVAVPDVFGWLLELVGVYCQLDQHDGLFDSLLYDVTEIDPVTRRQWLSDNQLENDPVKAEGMSSRKGVGFCYDPDAPARSAMKTHVKKARPSEEKRAASVLELICETGRAKKAFDVLNTPVVRRIVKDKWNHYWHYVLMWGVIHLVFMVSLTCHIVFKADLISRREEQSDTFPPSQKLFVDVMAALSILMALVLLVFDVAVVRVWQNQPYEVCITHHNGMYRIILIFMASSLILDSIWYFAAGPDNNYFLTLAVLLGWWFLTFFLRTLPTFSFFTVMLQKVLLEDMFRFTVILLLEFVAFTFAMYAVFLATPGPTVSGFSNLGQSMLTMFNLMVGLSEIDVLNDAANPWLAITLYALFVVFTYLVALNSLIAMMSHTCSLVFTDKCKSGQEREVPQYRLHSRSWAQVKRYFRKVRALHKDRHAELLETFRKQERKLREIENEDHARKDATMLIGRSSLARAKQGLSTLRGTGRNTAGSQPRRKKSKKIQPDMPEPEVYSISPHPQGSTA